MSRVLLLLFQQGNQGCAVATNDSNRLNPVLQMSKPPLYERQTLREDSDIRGRGEQYFEEDQQEQGWKQREHMPDERQQGYNHPVKPRNSNRTRYEGILCCADYLENVDSVWICLKYARF